MSGTISYKSSLLFLVASPESLLRIRANLGILSEHEPLPGAGGFLEFAPLFASSEAELLQKLEAVKDEAAPSGVIVVSDILTSTNDHAGYFPSDVARSIREGFRAGQRLCGLVALVPHGEHRTTDIDRVVSAGDLDVGRLRKVIVKTAMGLWMKAPPTSVSPSFLEAGAIRVQTVQSREEMRKCLALRYQVYDIMGYLPEDVTNSEAAIEMDSFDINAIHFIAIDTRLGETVGTARLVLQDVPRYMRESVIGAPQQTRDCQRGWCEEIASGLAGSACRERIEHPYFAPLPILQSSDFKERWSAILHEVAQGGELSRVVVAPSCRGLGVSRLLVRMGIAAAVDLGKSFLLLECVPTHAGMYAQYGFSLLEGHHCRTQELDQVAFGMRLDLKDSPDNEALALARRDIQMISRGSPRTGRFQGAGFLCLCGLTPCWRNGYYESRGAADCPLQSIIGKEKS